MLPGSLAELRVRMTGEDGLKLSVLPRQREREWWGRTYLPVSDAGGFSKEAEQKGGGIEREAGLGSGRNHTGGDFGVGCV